MKFWKTCVIGITFDSILILIADVFFGVHEPWFNWVILSGIFLIVSTIYVVIVQLLSGEFDHLRDGNTE